MSEIQNQAERLLLISNSTLHGSGYLDHAEQEIRDVLGSAKRVLFVPFALHDRDAYAAQARKRFEAMGYDLDRFMRSPMRGMPLTRRLSTHISPTLKCLIPGPS